MSAIRQKFPDLPPIWALGFTLASVAVGRLLPPGPFQHGFFRVLGFGLIAGGIGLAVWAALWFRRKRTSIEPGDIPKHLIVEGPFRINRNPIYSGMALVIFGAAFAWGGPASLIVAAIFPPLITQRFIRDEEDALRTAFGAEAQQYFTQSRRW